MWATSQNWNCPTSHILSSFDLSSFRYYSVAFFFSASHHYLCFPYPGGGVLPALGLMCWWLHRQLKTAWWVATNAREGPKVSHGYLSSPHITSPRQEPAAGAAEGDGAPLGGLLLKPRAPSCWHVQSFQHGWHLLSGQHWYLCANWFTR